jgi:hypothetical protein
MTFIPVNKPIANPTQTQAYPSANPPIPQYPFPIVKNKKPFQFQETSFNPHRQNFLASK